MVRGSVVVAAAVGALAACGGGTQDTGSGAATFGRAVSISISPPSIALQSGGVTQFTATVANSDDRFVTWSVSDAGSVTQDGVYTAPATPGTYHVLAMSHAAPAQVAIAIVNVSTTGAISVSPQIGFVTVGGALQLSARVTGVGDTRVQWSADLGNVDGSGLYLAPATSGTAHVTATSIGNPALAATATIQVRPASRVTVTLTPRTPVVEPKQMVRFISSVSGASNVAVTWSLLEMNGGTIDQTGRYTAPSADGVFHVLATSVDDPTAVGSAEVRVTSDSIDAGGPILPAANAYALFWGDATGFPADEQAAVESLLGSLDGSAYLATMDQYMRGAQARVRYAGSWFDPLTPPSGFPSTSQVEAEVCAQINANGAQPDPQGIYLVYLATGQAGTGYCGWHYFGACNGSKIAFALLPNPMFEGGCNYAGGLNCNGYSTYAQTVASVTAHELFEAMTDPFVTAWGGSGSEEVADKCNARFSACVPLTSGNWQLQQMWSNAVHACVQQ